MYTDCYVFFVLNAYQSCKKCILVCKFYAIFYFFCFEYIPNEIISIWYVFFYDLVGNFLIVYIPKLKKISLVCICFWFTGWILLKIHTIFSIKQIGMHKGDLSREFYPNFTYQIVFTHFGMYILDCHDFLAKISQWRGENGLPRPKGLAMTGELIAVLLLVMTVQNFWGILRGLPLRRWGGGKDRSTLCEDFGARGGCPPLIMKILCWLLKWEKKSII